jgi:CRP/FNR family cyclic AMP-dependent transcriptional regulator
MVSRAGAHRTWLAPTPEPETTAEMALARAPLRLATRTSEERIDAPSDVASMSNEQETSLEAQASLSPAVGATLVATVKRAASMESCLSWRPISLPAGRGVSLDFARLGLIHVESGMLKLVATKTDERRCILNLCFPGDLTAFQSSPAGALSVSIVAASSAKVTVLGKRHLDELMEQPHVARDLLGVFAQEARISQARTTHHQSTDANGRAAFTVCRLAERLGRDSPIGVAVDHPFTYDDLARFSGLTRETFGRALSSFIARGWLTTDRHTLTLINEHSLRCRARLASHNTPR